MTQPTPTRATAATAPCRSRCRSRRDDTVTLINFRKYYEKLFTSYVRPSLLDAGGRLRSRPDRCRRQPLHWACLYPRSIPRAAARGTQRDRHRLQNGFDWELILPGTIASGRCVLPARLGICAKAVRQRRESSFYGQPRRIYRPWLINLLDNAIYDKKLPVMVIIFADNGGDDNGIGFAHVQGTERNLEYDTVSARYGQWVQAELLPRVESETRSQIPDQAVSLTSDPEGRGAIGCSSGAAAAFTMAWFQPGSFRRIISYSGSYTNLQSPADPNYPHGASSYSERLIKDSPKKPIRMWLEVGSQDIDWSQFGNFLDWQAANRAMASVLKSKGYQYHFDLAQDARHCDGRVPAQTLSEAMQWLWKDYPIK
jgi:hypothetical protein